MITDATARSYLTTARPHLNRDWTDLTHIASAPRPTPLPPVTKQDTFNGTAGDDLLVGTSGDDAFYMQDGGDDSIFASGGDDVFYFGDTLNAGDAIDGGSGYDHVVMTGGGDSMPGNMAGIEEINFVESTGHQNFYIGLGASNVGASQTLKIDGQGLIGDVMEVSGSTFFDDDTVGNLIFVGGTGWNGFAGGAGNDDLDMTNSTAASVDPLYYGYTTSYAFGLGGNDIIRVGDTLPWLEAVGGGMGDDTITLGGTSYSDVTDFHRVFDDILGDHHDYSVVTGVETIVLGAGFDYNLFPEERTVEASANLNIDASALGSGNWLICDGYRETDGYFTITGGDGNDIVTGGSQRDVIRTGGGIDVVGLWAGGNDFVELGAGDDTVQFYAALTPGDHADGGDGYDILTLEGDYHNLLTFLDTTLINVEEIRLSGALDYNLKLTDATIANATSLYVNAASLGVTDAVFFDWSAETGGRVVIDSGAGADLLTGGAGNDVFGLAAGGADNARGGGGADTFSMGATLTKEDKLNGGGGGDTVNLDGDYSSVVKFSAGTLEKIETLHLAGGHNYKLTENDANLAASNTLTVDASGLLAGDVLIFNGSFEASGRFIFRSGLGADSLTGGHGADQFAYTSVTQSTSTHFDTIGGFDANADKFDLWFAVTGVDAKVTGGTLRTGHFDSDLAAAVNNTHLAGHHAVLFAPDAGNNAGKTLLIVDVNGTAGYQAGLDLVMQLDGAAHLAGLDTGDFI